MRSVPFPNTPAQVRACLSRAEEGAVAVERDGAAPIVIMPVEEYTRLVELDVRSADREEAGETDGRNSEIGVEAGAIGSGRL